MKKDFVTVGIIVKNEELHIAETINSVIASDFPKTKYEVLIVDGNSTDNTQKIIKKIIKKHKNIRLVLEPWKKGTHGMARNLCAKEAKGEYLAFTDGDCIVKKNWLSTVVNSLKAERKTNNKVVALGGIRTPVKTKNWKENLINRMMATFFGSGGSKGFTQTKKKYIDSIPNYNAIYLTKIVRKEKYSELGVGEDYEFNLRLNKIGYKIVFDQDAVIYHHQANNFKDFFKQVFYYGRAQIRILKRIKRVRYFAIIAPLFVLGLFFGAILSVLFKPILYIYLAAVGFYVLLDLVYTLNVVFKTKKLYGFLAFVLFPMEHISYGLGSLKSFFQK